MDEVDAEQTAEEGAKFAVSGTTVPAAVVKKSTP
jgi:hypothetical protein